LITNSPEPADSDLYLVVLEEAVEGKSSIFLNIEGSDQTDVDERVATLKRELSNKDEYLQSISEQLESMNEELRSSNEEMQSVNEELQSTNEELETSKEELQSINEELTTVNTELQTKVADLSQANNDLSNFLASTGIGTIFVNHQQRVKRFTPSAANIMNLILSDIGRPLAHVTSSLVSYNQIREDIQEVLDTLIPKELEVQTTNSKWYSMRIQPYRTIDNVIEGAVLTFVDISETVKAREALKTVNEVLRLAVVVRDSRDAITVQGLDGHILAWNSSAYRMYGWSETEALHMNISELIPKDRNKRELIILHELIQNQTLEPYRTQRTAKNGTTIEIMLTATALIDETGQVYAIATTERAVDNTL
jgi:two-component system CheB/CheR fusion protein